MLGVGMGEMILIGAIALIVIGPEKFPDFAKIALRTMRDLRGYVDDIQNEVSKELRPLKKEIDTISRDSQKYIETLSKDTNKAFSNEKVTTPSVPKSQADPTDRQDDSFDYGSGHGAATDAGSHNGGGGEERVAGETQESSADGHPEQPVKTQDQASVNAEDVSQADSDLPGKPVERLD